MDFGLMKEEFNGLVILHVKHVPDLTQIIVYLAMKTQLQYSNHIFPV